MSHQYQVLLFGPQAQQAGMRELTIQAPHKVLNISQLKNEIAQKVSTIADTLCSSCFAVNHELAGDEKVVNPDDEIALIGMIGNEDE